MKLCPFASLLLTLITGTILVAAPTVDLEIVTERGVQITAPQEWLQLLARAGIDNVRIRAGRAGDEPSVTNVGDPSRPRYRVVGLLTAREQLRLKGATFGRGDLHRLNDYFEQLAADGAESLTAPRGRYGLTEREIETVFNALNRRVGFATNGTPLREVLDRIGASTTLEFQVDRGAASALRDEAPIDEEVEGLTVGTALAIVLWNRSLVLVPEKPRGKPVALRISEASDTARRASTLGHPDDKTQSFWPVGWAPEALPRELAPSLFKSLNAEIDGYTLEETLSAVGPQLKIPLYLDRLALAESNIDLAKVKVSLPRARTYYKRVLDRVLAQARLGAQLRIDEAGTPFLWVTR